MLRITHNEKPMRESVWRWKSKNGYTKWHIESYLDGYYQAQCCREGIMMTEDFQRNLESLRSLSSEIFTVKEYKGGN